MVRKVVPIKNQREALEMREWIRVYGIMLGCAAASCFWLASELRISSVGVPVSWPLVFIHTGFILVCLGIIAWRFHRRRTVESPSQTEP